MLFRSQDAVALAARRAGKAFVRSDDAIFTPVGRLNPRWSAALRHRLAARYGHLAPELSADALEADLQTIAGTDTLWLELVIAARCEAVLHLDDLLLRRTRLGILLPHGALEHLARIRATCEPHLQWGDALWATELARYRALITAHYQLPGRTSEAPTP